MVFIIVTSIYMAYINHYKTMIKLDAPVEKMYKSIIDSGWDPEIMRNFGDPNFNKFIERGYNDGVYTQLRKLGGVKSYDGIGGWSSISYGKIGTAKANVYITFANGERVLTTDLVRVDNKWYLAGINPHPVEHKPMRDA